MAIPGVMAGIGVIIAFVFVVQNTAGAIESASETIDANNFIISKKQSEQAKFWESIEVMEADLGIARKYLDDFTVMYDSINIQSNSVNYDMKATINNLVDGIGYTTISYSPENLVINGTSPSEAEVLEYATRLRDANRFSEVIVTNIRYLDTSENPDESFHYVLTLIE